MSPLNEDEALRFLQTMAAAAEGVGLARYNPPHALALPPDPRILGRPPAPGGRQPAARV
jgi:hypothetical protein